MKRNVPKEIKSIARERVGRVKGTKIIVPKTKRKPKHRTKDGVGGEYCNACGRHFGDGE